MSQIKSTLSKQTIKYVGIILFSISYRFVGNFYPNDRWCNCNIINMMILRKVPVFSPLLFLILTLGQRRDPTLFHLIPHQSPVFFQLVSLIKKTRAFSLFEQAWSRDSFKIIYLGRYQDFYFTIAKHTSTSSKERHAKSNQRAFRIHRSSLQNRPQCVIEHLHLPRFPSTILPQKYQ